MVKRVIGIILIVVAAFGLLGFAVSMSTSESTSNDIAALVLVAIVLIVGVFLLYKSSHTSKNAEKQNKEMRNIRAKEYQKDLMARTLQVEHMTGLPLAQNANVNVVFKNDSLIINGGGNDFSLSYSKVSSIELKTSTEIQKAYVSSTGGAVAGAVMFGALGAIIGGRAKEKTTRTVEHFLLITYLKDGNVEYISFKIPYERISKVDKIVGRFKPRFTAKAQISL